MEKFALKSIISSQSRQEIEVFEFINSIRYRDRYKFCKRAFLYGSRSRLEREEVKDSDWDIAVPTSGLFVEELSLDGWEQKDISNTDYRDHYTTHIFEKTFPSGAVVQISFKSDYDSFKAVWNNIPYEVYKALIWKKSESFLGKDGVCGFINSLKRVYDCGAFRGEFPSSQDKFLRAVADNAPPKRRDLEAVPVEAFDEQPQLPRVNIRVEGAFEAEF